jgi:DNA-binding MarR family transcriptional regulator
MSITAAHTPVVEPPAIGGLLRMVWLAHRDRIFRRIGERGYPELTRAQFALFRWPGVDGMRPTEVAELAGLSKQAVNDTLRELERQGYLGRHADPTDGRARIVRLTKRGHALQGAVHETSIEVEASWAAVVGDDRLAALRATLIDMLAASEKA